MLNGDLKQSFKIQHPNQYITREMIIFDFILYLLLKASELSINLLKFTLYQQRWNKIYKYFKISFPNDVFVNVSVSKPHVLDFG